jgi:non-canonical (house-cleaning) NTP pyrophosphatase
LIPYSVFDALKQGEELGTVIDKQYGTRNIKQKGGAISVLTRGLATRQSVYVTATLMAMSAFD